MELNWLRDCNICMKMELFLEIWNLQMFCWMSMGISNCLILEIHENWLIYCLIVKRRNLREVIQELLIIWRQSYSQMMEYFLFKAIFGPLVVFSTNFPLENLHSTAKPSMNWSLKSQNLQFLERTCLQNSQISFKDYSKKTLYFDSHGPKSKVIHFGKELNLRHEHSLDNKCLSNT